jgi:hypothetical protein
MMKKGDMKQLQSFLHALEEITDRTRALSQADSATPAHPRVADLTGLMREWRTSLQGISTELSVRPGTADLTVSRARLQDTVARIEEQIEGALDNFGEKGLSLAERENVYRMLGICLRVSDALMHAIEKVLPIDWTRLREARF